MKRQRGRGRKGNNNNNNHNHGNRSFDSNGPDVKVRGNASQVHDKYTALARDAASSGNRVKAENLRQHAEHYLRVANEQEAAKQAAREEAEARREKQNENKASNDDGDNNEGDSKKHERRSRRQPARKPSNEDTDAKPKTNETSDALEVVKPEAGDVVAAKDEAPKVPRRRKAPAKPKPDEAVDAAE